MTKAKLISIICLPCGEEQWATTLSSCHNKYVRYIGELAERHLTSSSLGCEVYIVKTAFDMKLNDTSEGFPPASHYVLARVTMLAKNIHL